MNQHSLKWHTTNCWHQGKYTTAWCGSGSELRLTLVTQRNQPLTSLHLQSPSALQTQCHHARSYNTLSTQHRGRTVVSKGRSSPLAMLPPSQTSYTQLDQAGREVCVRTEHAGSGETNTSVTRHEHWVFCTL